MGESPLEKWGFIYNGCFASCGTSRAYGPYSAYGVNGRSQKKKPKPSKTKLKN